MRPRGGAAPPPAHGARRQTPVAVRGTALAAVRGKLSAPLLLVLGLLVLGLSLLGCGGEPQDDSASHPEIQVTEEHPVDSPKAGGTAAEAAADNAAEARTEAAPGAATEPGSTP